MVEMLQAYIDRFDTGIKEQSCSRSVLAPNYIVEEQLELQHFCLSGTDRTATFFSEGTNRTATFFRAEQIELQHFFQGNK